MVASKGAKLKIAKCDLKRPMFKVSIFHLKECIRSQFVILEINEKGEDR
jgi:hypothetical protein